MWKNIGWSAVLLPRYSSIYYIIAGEQTIKTCSRNLLSVLPCRRQPIYRHIFFATSTQGGVVVLDNNRRYEFYVVVILDTQVDLAYIHHCGINHHTQTCFSLQPTAAVVVYIHMAAEYIAACSEMSKCPLGPPCSTLALVYIAVGISSVSNWYWSWKVLSKYQHVNVRRTHGFLWLPVGNKTYPC